MNKISIALSVAALLMVGCSDKEEKQNMNKADSLKESPMKQAPQNLYGTTSEQGTVAAAESNESRLPAQQIQHTGKVLETVDAAGYTYVKVEEGTDVYWIAGPKTAVTIGSKISFIEQMVMENFTSKSLNKTFEYIVFASTIIPVDASEQATLAIHKHNDSNDTCDTPEKVESSHATASNEVTSVKVSKNKNGYSVEELYSKSSELNGKSIKVNATVVKVSKNIMGKDWIHLQDGTGQSGTNDIIATSVNSAVNVGEMFTVDGIVKTNVDLGYGYKFSAIIEEAKFSSIN